MSPSHDVIVVGAGITGLTTALALREAGARVLVLEASQGGETSTTWSSTGHLTEVLDPPYQKLKDNFGRDDAAAVLAGARAAVDRIEELIRLHDIACGFVRLAAYRYSEKEDELGKLEQEAQVARELGVDATFTHEVPLPFAKGGILVPRQAQFTPPKYLRGLADALVRAGGEIRWGTRVHQVDEGETCEVHVRGEVLRAPHVVLATHTPLGKHFIQTKLGPYRSYAISIGLADHEPPRALFWDTSDPYHYLRSDESGAYLVVGGADHKTGQCEDTEGRFHQLEGWARERFGPIHLVAGGRMTAELFEPADALPYVGPLTSKGRLLAATGFAGVGLSQGTMAAGLLADLVLGRKTLLAGILSPRRHKPLASVRDFVRENFNAVRRMVTDRLREGDVETVEEIAPGDGRLVNVGLHKVAVYREETGNLRAYSATCTHMGCVVQWNNSQKTWDCPCHGGIFSRTGEVLAGPPPRALEPFDLPDMTGEVVTDEEPAVADGEPEQYPAGGVHLRIVRE